MLQIYPAILHEENGFWIEFPDLEGCQTCGATLEETMELAQEALGLYLVSLAEHGQAIPTPSSIADISTDTGQKTYVSTPGESYQQDAGDKEMEKSAIYALGIQKDKTDFRRV